MTRAYSASGYKLVAATPHMIAGTGWMPSVGQIEEKIDELNPSIAEERVELVVVSCAEKPSLVELLIESGVYLQLTVAIL